MSADNQVLVAILPSERDLKLAREAQWYRIPVYSAKRWLSRRWPPHWLAFYQPKVFGAEAYAVRYYSQVLDVREVERGQLFPHEPQGSRGAELYFQLILGPLQHLPQPIFSRRWRRIVFIQTTWQKLIAAAEINDLFDDSPLEDRLWAELKRLQILAERQELFETGAQSFFLDFAVYCISGRLDIETDGDAWHIERDRAAGDNLRDNALETKGWKLLRFNTQQINEQMMEYCLPTIVENINRLGGVDERRVIPRPAQLDPNKPAQLNLFDDLSR